MHSRLVKDLIAFQLNLNYCRFSWFLYTWYIKLVKNDTYFTPNGKRFIKCTINKGLYWTFGVKKSYSFAWIARQINCVHLGSVSVMNWIISTVVSIMMSMTTLILQWWRPQQFLLFKLKLIKTNIDIKMLAYLEWDWQNRQYHNS